MKALRWALINCSIFALLWAGLAWNIQGARNVGLFAVWIGFAISLFLCGDKLCKEVARKSIPISSVPPWLDVTFDLFLVGLLIWFGRWCAGAAWFIQLLCCRAMREKVKRIREEMNQSQPDAK